MINVPASLKQEIQKLRGRRLKARVRIDYSDVNIDNTIIGYSNGFANGTYTDQVYNGKEDVSEKWISLDGVWVLDGSYVLGPATPTEQSQLEIGWWSHNLCESDGFFNDSPGVLYAEAIYGEEIYDGKCCVPELGLSFVPRTFSDIRISFDNMREEYAVDFDLAFFDADNNELHREEVRGNSGFRYTNTITTINQVSFAIFTPIRWSRPGSHAKVAELVTSVSDLYQGDDLISLDVIENRSIDKNGNPIGSTASGQCVVTLYNRNRLFDFDNTSSKLFNLVRENVRIVPQIGDGTNWIPLGVFFAKAWDISKQDITVRVTGLDRMALLQQSVYDKSEIIQAPDDENISVDTTAEWAGGNLSGVIADDNEIRLEL